MKKSITILTTIIVTICSLICCPLEVKAEATEDGVIWDTNMYTIAFTDDTTAKDDLEDQRYIYALFGIRKIGTISNDTYEVNTNKPITNAYEKDVYELHMMTFATGKYYGRLTCETESLDRETEADLIMGVPLDTTGRFPEDFTYIIETNAGDTAIARKPLTISQEMVGPNAGIRGVEQRITAWVPETGSYDNILFVFPAPNPLDMYDGTVAGKNDAIGSDGSTPESTYGNQNNIANNMIPRLLARDPHDSTYYNPNYQLPIQVNDYNFPPQAYAIQFRWDTNSDGTYYARFEKNTSGGSSESTSPGDEDKLEQQQQQIESDKQALEEYEETEAELTEAGNQKLDEWDIAGDTQVLTTSKFMNTAEWVRLRYEDLTRGTPIETITILFLTLAAALWIIGRRG